MEMSKPPVLGKVFQDDRTLFYCYFNPEFSLSNPRFDSQLEEISKTIIWTFKS